jgi:hypothetical protein
MASVIMARGDMPSSAGWRRGERLPYKNEADLQRFLDGLRKAGLPE